MTKNIQVFKNRHQKANRNLNKEARRGSSTQRGYDRLWSKLRARYITENPFCESCEKRGLTVPADEVDHIQPFSGKDDPLRLDEDNLQSLCRACHARKTART